MYCYLWEFHVLPEHQGSFEAAYGPAGDWVQLFRQDPAYRGTQLLKDRENPSRYVTIDTWANREAYLSFRRQFRDAFAGLDASCETLTQKEVALGEFEVLTSPPG